MNKLIEFKLNPFWLEKNQEEKTYFKVEMMKTHKDVWEYSSDVEFPDEYPKLSIDEDIVTVTYIDVEKDEDKIFWRASESDINYFEDEILSLSEHDMLIRLLTRYSQSIRAYAENKEKQRQKEEQDKEKWEQRGVEHTVV
ncbi:hypothetical protein [Veillonella sp. VA139]|uniref:hypothetical protein n=1 Tax=Veillonella sp. VA139 TaxID=741830 RepID=UPI000F8D2395|nr:hypothetical protein [Veillonella sp. VA139]